MRMSSLVLVAVGLAACAPSTPDSYQSYMRSQMNGMNPVPQAYQQPAPQGFSTAGALEAINSAGGAAPLALPAGERPRGNAPNNIRAEMGEMVNVQGNVGISNENSFEAVTAERSIAEDAAVIAQNRARYVQVQPTAVPSRPNSGAPNIVAYALQQNHPRGQQMYGRSSIRFSDSAQQCAQYLSADLAQEAFLQGGGPQRDRYNLDPDGDGYACAWDPAPFRAAAG
nr:hypothetical protein [Falsirhodobacter deserti]